MSDIRNGNKQKKPLTFLLKTYFDIHGEKITNSLELKSQMLPT